MEIKTAVLEFYASLAYRHFRAGRLSAYMTVRMLVREAYGRGWLIWLDDRVNKKG